MHWCTSHFFTTNTLFAVHLSFLGVFLVIALTFFSPWTVSCLTWVCVWVCVCVTLQHQSLRLSDVHKKSQLWRGIVSISLIEAHDLQPMDANGLSDPYVKFRMGHQKYKSKVWSTWAVFQLLVVHLRLFLSCNVNSNRAFLFCCADNTKNAKPPVERAVWLPPVRWAGRFHWHHRLGQRCREERWLYGQVGHELCVYVKLCYYHALMVWSDKLWLLKRIVHQKIKIMSSFTHPVVPSNLKFFLLLNTKDAKFIYLDLYNSSWIWSAESRVIF